MSAPLPHGARSAWLAAALVVVALALLAPARLAAQEAPAVSEARSLRDAGQIAAAAARLREHLVLEPADTDARWLLAHTLYWLGRFDEARAEYLRALDARPGDAALRLDAAHFLHEIGRVGEARRVLAPLGDGGGLDPGLAAQVRELRRAIAITTAPWIRLRPEVVHDDQPLTRAGAELEAGAFLVPGLALTLRAAPMRSEAGPLETEILELEAGVLLAWPEARLEARGSAGAALRSTPETTGAIGRARLGFRLPQNLFLRGEASRRPYLWTERSLATSLLVDSYEVALDRHDAPGWAGEAGARLDRFPDDNQVRSGWVWLLAPVLRRPAGSLRAGYAFQVQDADQSRFTAGGAYDPYYTPEEQLVHSAIAAGTVGLGTAAALYLDGAVGVHASELAPEIGTGPGEGPGRGPPGVAFVERGFTPWRARATIAADIGAASTLRVVASHDRGAFFEITQGSVELVWRFAR